MMKSTLYRFFSWIYAYITHNSQFSYSFKSLGKDSFIDSSCKIVHPSQIIIGNEVSIEKDSWLNIVSQKSKTGSIQIEGGTKIGSRVTISSVKDIVIHKNVLVGMNVYIADHEHEYQEIYKPIMFQELKIGEGIEIGQGTWIGTNVVISSAKKLTIGKNCVIGANSVVKASMPDYVIAAGVPAKIIKKYDKRSKKWINV